MSVRQLITAIGLSPLEQDGIVTLSELVDDLAEAGARLRRGLAAGFRWIESQTGLIVPRASIVELSDDLRPHLHVITRAPRIPVRLFQEACSKKGLGYSWIKDFHGDACAMGAYLLKTIRPARGQPFVADEAALETFLTMNARRLINTSRHFWIDRDGTVLRDAAEARKAGRREWGARRDPS